MTPEEKEVILWALCWKQNWDETGMPDYRTVTYVTKCDIGFMK